MTKMQFLEKARETHGYKYNYINLSDKIKLSDKIQVELSGSTFTQTVSKHLSGRCPEKKVNKKTTKDFIKSAKKIWGDKYDYSLVEYSGSLDVVKIIHDNVVYEQRASSHLSGMAPEFRKTEDSITRDNIRESESIGENEISKFLNKYQIKYKKKQKIDDIEFDFYIPSIRVCIEFNGRQHYEPIIDLGGLKTYESVREVDKLKSDYCEENFINLIIIRHDQIDDIYQVLWENLKNLIKIKKIN